MAKPQDRGRVRSMVRLGLEPLVSNLTNRARDKIPSFLPLSLQRRYHQNGALRQGIQNARPSRGSSGWLRHHHRWHGCARSTVLPIKVIASMPTFQPGNDVYLGHSSGQPVILYLNQPLTTLEEEDVQAQEAYYYWADSGNKEVSVSFDVTHQQNAPGQREPSGGVLV